MTVMESRSLSLWQRFTRAINRIGDAVSSDEAQQILHEQTEMSDTLHQIERRIGQRHRV